jgi:uncharacterized protein YihD (DUF1040 family)
MPSRWAGPPRDPARIDEMLEMLGKLWKRYPDLRLGQLIVNLVSPSSPCSEIFNREDDKLKEAILARMEENSSESKTLKNP